jgi:hypothetical protein
MPGGVHDAEILLPNANGDRNELGFQYPDAGEHWDKVDDFPADDGETYLGTAHFNQYQTDLYQLADHTPDALGVEREIEGVTVFFRFSGFTDGGDHEARAKAAIKTYGNVYEGPRRCRPGTAMSPNLTVGRQPRHRPALDVGRD